MTRAPDRAPDGTRALEVVRTVLESDFGIARDLVVPAARLADDLDFDSIDAVDLAHRLEEVLDIAFADDVFERVECVGDIVARIDECLASRERGDA